MACEQCMVTCNMMLKQQNEYITHLKQQNNTLLSILANNNKLILHKDDDTQLTKSIDDILKSNNDMITDSYILTVMETTRPEHYNALSDFLSRYIKNDAIVYDRRKNTFKFLDNFDIVTETYVLFIQRVFNFSISRVKMLIINKNTTLVDDINNGICGEYIDTEYAKDSNRTKNISIMTESSTIDKVYLKFRATHI